METLREHCINCSEGNSCPLYKQWYKRLNWFEKRVFEKPEGE